MRDPQRITVFCNRLKRIWSCVPDWRFGQLMSNMLGAYVAQTGADIFFPEDPDLFDFFDQYMRTSGATPYRRPEDWKSSAEMTNLDRIRDLSRLQLSVELAKHPNFTDDDWFSWLGKKVGEE